VMGASKVCLETAGAALGKRPAQNEWEGLGDKAHVFVWGREGKEGVGEVGWGMGVGGVRASAAC